MTDEKEYDLHKSSKMLGRLYPILKDKDGNIIDGNHRQNADPNWESVSVPYIDTPVKLELARLAVNFCRRTVEVPELKRIIKYLVNQGVSPKTISEQTGISRTTIYKYMPPEAKNEKHVESGRKAGVASGEVRSLANEPIVPQEMSEMQFKEEIARRLVSLPNMQYYTIVWPNSRKTWVLFPEGKKE